jgi:4-amino-4-deoxy-L-arabinose transferase-like glycosyltransferase
VINSIIRNPFYSVIATCLLFFVTAGMFFNNSYIDEICVNYIFISVTFTLFQKKFTDSILLIWASIFFLILRLFIIEKDLILLIAEIFFAGYNYYKNKNNRQSLTFFIITTSLFIHLFYIQKTDLNFFQHDLSGIITYLNKIAEDGFAWQSFNPWYMYYTFHQPLCFIINQYLYLLGRQLWTSSSVAFEGLQYLSLFYVTSSSILFAKILNILKFRGNIYYSLLFLFSFNPTLTLFSGYISNDVDVLFWSLFTLYYLLRWYRIGKYKNILFAAIGFGLGVLSKLSILILVPAISVLFLIKIVKAHNKSLIVRDICLFIIVAVPLSLTWIIRNHILFDMQFYNIPDTSPEGQNFKLLTLKDRITDFSMLLSPFIEAPKIADANMFLAIVKTELFGEWNLSLLNKGVIIPSYALYFLNIVLKICTFTGLLFLLIKNRLKQHNLIWLFLTMWLSLWGYMLNYALKYPYICSTDYRLFSALMFTECIILGYALCNNIILKKILYIASIIYAILSSIIYMMII